MSLKSTFDNGVKKDRKTGGGASNSWQSPYRLPNILVQYCIPLYILCTHVYPCNTVYPVYPYIPCVPMFSLVILYTLYTLIYLVYPCLL